MKLPSMAARKGLAGNRAQEERRRGELAELVEQGGPPREKAPKGVSVGKG